MALTRAGLSETLRSRLNHTTDTDTEINFCQGSFNSCIEMDVLHTAKNDKKPRTCVHCSASRRSTEPDSVVKYR